MGISRSKSIFVARNCERSQVNYPHGVLWSSLWERPSPFAPTDEAFGKLPKGTVESLLKPENKAKLAAVQTYHVVPGKVMAADVVKLSKAKTVQGSEVKITVKGGKVKVDDANVVNTDIKCKNGVIHIIDAVILPK